MNIIRKYNFFVAIAGAILIGFLTRIHSLAYWILSADEAFCIRVAGLRYIDIIKSCIEDVHPPFYYFLFHNYLFIFGNSEFSSRMFSVIFGILSIYVIYILGKFLFDRWTGVVSSFLLSLSIIILDYSQRARMYTLLLFLSLASVYLYLYILKKHKESSFNSRYYYFLFIVNLFLLYTHIYGIFVVTFEFFWLGIVYFRNKNWNNIKKILYSLVASSVLFSPWTIAILNAKAERSEPWLDATNLIDIANRFSGNNYVAALLIPLFISPLFVKKLRNENIAILYVLIFFTVIIPYLISIFIYPEFQPRYVIFDAAIFYIVIAYTFVNIDSRLARINLSIWFFAVSFMLLGEYYNGPDNADWKSASAYLDNNAKVNDLVIFSAGYTLENVFWYYSHNKKINGIPFPKMSERINIPVDESNILELDEPLSKGYQDIYVAYHEHRDYNDLIVRKLEEYGYFLMEDVEFNGIQIFKFSRE